MKRAVLCLTVTAAWGQSMQQTVAQGEKLFNQTCATGYCHALRGGGGGGAPRLAGRGFDEAYINTTVTRGVPGTAMPAFGTVLPRPDFVAVVAYVATLNGIAAPNVNAGGRGGAPRQPALQGEAARGHDLFFDSLKGFGRCSTCHEVNGAGIAVASPISRIPAGVAALRALDTPGVKTATANGESMPALIISQGKTQTIFFDLTTSPPVQRTFAPGSASFADASSWRHASALAAYNDGDLEAILAYLQAVTRP